ncbi:MAG TPA: DUF1232 domain-containing protein [Caulifigura sp.]|jgi:uncharacterized membrane protein YkvA (DUF1232 family)|nr:DUF1232 domain-containing protein [Caulifigura sp.]
MFRKLVISILTRLAGRQRAAAAANVAGASKTLQNPTLSALLAVAALAYAISPVDAMPDFIPILGWLDDGLILWLGLSQALKAMRGRQPEPVPVTVIETTASRVS